MSAKMKPKMKAMLKSTPHAWFLSSATGMKQPKSTPSHIKALSVTFTAIYNTISSALKELLMPSEMDLVNI
jgi:hypothetical protein